MSVHLASRELDPAVIERAIAALRALPVDTPDDETARWLAALRELRNRLVHHSLAVPADAATQLLVTEFLTLIERSSLGTPDAAAWRERTSADLIETVIGLAPTAGGQHSPAPGNSAYSSYAAPPDTMPSRSAVPDAADEAHESGGLGTNLLIETYQAHYNSLIRLAALLLDDVTSCEDVVQEAFIRVHAARSHVREPEKLLAYLRQTVVNLSRSALRRRLLRLTLLPKPMPDVASAEEGAYDLIERDALVRALHTLQRRQREVLVLRYYGDMTDAQVSEVLGVSVGSVKAYGSRGIEALRARMEAAGHG